jgi:hypothetical protein
VLVGREPRKETLVVHGFSVAELAGFRRPAELPAHALRESADDEVVRVLDQVAHELVAKAAVDRDRVPVPLVEVVAGADRVIAVSQLGGQLRLAL